MHMAEREEDDQTLSNAFVSLSEDPQSGAEAIGVNGCAAILWDLPIRTRKLNPLSAQLQSDFKKKEKREEIKEWKEFCLLKASGRVRARTRVDLEQVVQWKRGQRDGRRAGKTIKKQLCTLNELGTSRRESKRSRQRWKKEGQII